MLGTKSTGMIPPKSVTVLGGYLPSGELQFGLICL